MLLFRRPRQAKRVSSSAGVDNGREASAFNLTSADFEAGEARRARARAAKAAAAADAAAELAAEVAAAEKKLRLGRELREAEEVARKKRMREEEAAALETGAAVRPHKKMRTHVEDGVTIRAPSQKLRDFDRRTGRGKLYGAWKVSSGTEGVLTTDVYKKLGAVYRQRRRHVQWSWQRAAPSETADRRKPRTTPAAGSGPQP